MYFASRNYLTDLSILGKYNLQIVKFYGHDCKLVISFAGK